VLASAMPKARVVNPILLEVCITCVQRNVITLSRRDRVCIWPMIDDRGTWIYFRSEVIWSSSPTEYTVSCTILEMDPWDRLDSRSLRFLSSWSNTVTKSSWRKRAERRTIGAFHTGGVPHGMEEWGRLAGINEATGRTAN
jgi:hypothetical protein